MEQVPKIVEARLRAVAPGDQHPDPNQLAAFAERALGERERGQVLNHLAQCADCREVVLLSQPELEPLIVGEGSRSKAGWFAFPMMRWAALAACVVIVGAAVTLYRQNTSLSRVREEVTVSKDTSSSVALTASGNEAAISENKASQPELRDKLASTDKLASAEKKEIGALSAQVGGAGKQRVAASRAVTSGADFASGAAPSSPAREPEAQLAASVASPPAAAPAVPAPAEKDERRDAMKKAQSDISNQVTVETSSASVQPGKTASLADQASTDSVSSNAKADRKFSEAQAGLSAGMLKQKSNAGSVVVGLKPVYNRPRWTLSSDGSLLRSTDGGNSWSVISVARDTTFRAVVSLGADVWCGGNGGALYHSEDGGVTWAQIKLADNGKPLTADIVRIEFADSDHGTLSTADGQTWQTADAGKSWKRK